MEYDTWGNLRGDPQKVIEEKHGNNFVKVSIYRAGELFYYAYQLKVGTLIRQRVANIAAAYKTEGAAREAAGAEITDICAGNKNSKKAFAEFSKIHYAEYDLFGGLL